MKRRRVVEVKVEPRPVCQVQSHAIRELQTREKGYFMKVCDRTSCLRPAVDLAYLTKRINAILKERRLQIVFVVFFVLVDARLAERVNKF